MPLIAQTPVPTAMPARSDLPVVDIHPDSVRGLEVSFVLPCLNEANSLEACIREAQRCVADHNLKAEIVVADNGSTDGSIEIAQRCGARVVHVMEKGYGNALYSGIMAAHGKFIVMGDADFSYDFSQAFLLIDKLRQGADLAMGNRFKGGIEKGAMPPLHQFFGNPMMSLIGRLVFRSKVRDFYCGLRAFTKDAFIRMDTKTAGMDFALELVVKAQLRHMNIAEAPVRLRKDRRGRAPHLKSFRDGWRGLRFMLTLSPRFTLLYPGIALLALGVLLMALTASSPLTLGGVTLDLHTLVGGSLMVLIGYQLALTAFAMRLYTLAAEIGHVPDFLSRARTAFTLERGLIGGGLLCLAGLALMAVPSVRWVAVDFGHLDTPATLRFMILGATAAAVGVQTAMMSFVVSMFEITYRRRA